MGVESDYDSDSFLGEELNGDAYIPFGSEKDVSDNEVGNEEENRHEATPTMATGVESSGNSSEAEGTLSAPANMNKRYEEDYMKRMRTLDTHCTKNVSFASYGIGNEGATAVAAALGKNTTCPQIFLSNNLIGPGGATKLAEALKYNSSLRLLSLRGNFINDEGVTELANVLRSNSMLTKLDVTNNLIGPGGATKLAEALQYNTRLQELSLSSNPILYEGATELANALHSNSTLTTLDVTECSLGTRGTKALDDAVASNNKDRSTNLLVVESSSKDRSASMNTAAAAASKPKESAQRRGVGDLSNQSLRDVNTEAKEAQITILQNHKRNAVVQFGEDHKRKGPMEDNSPRASGKKQKLAQSKATADFALSPRKVVSFDSSSVDVPSFKCVHPYKQTNPPQQQHKKNGAGMDEKATSVVATGVGGGSARGALASFVNPRYEQCYMDAMKLLNSDSTKNVGFAGHEIGNDGATKVAAALKSNTTCPALFLSNNRIGPKGATTLAKALKNNTSLRSLSLINNPINDEGAKALANALRSNSTLTKLSVTSCNLDETGIKALQDALAANSRDRTIDMDKDKAKKPEKTIQPELVDLTEDTDDKMSASKPKDSALTGGGGGGGNKSARDSNKKAKEVENSTVRNDKLAAPRAEDVCTQVYQGSKPFLGSKTVAPARLANLLLASGTEAHLLGHLSIGVPNSNVGQPAQLQHLPQDRLPPKQHAQQHARQQCNKMHQKRAHLTDSGKSSNKPVVETERSGAAQKSAHSLSSREIVAAERQHEGGTSDFNEKLKDLKDKMEQESNDNENMHAGGDATVLGTSNLTREDRKHKRPEEGEEASGKKHKMQKPVTPSSALSPQKESTSQQVTRKQLLAQLRCYAWLPPCNGHSCSTQELHHYSSLLAMHLKREREKAISVGSCGGKGTNGDDKGVCNEESENEGNDDEERDDCRHGATAEEAKNKDEDLEKILGTGNFSEISVDLPLESERQRDADREPCTSCNQIHSIYDKQCEVAHRLFESIKTKINDQQYCDFEVYVLVPNLNSLYKQTINRLQDFIEETRRKQNLLNGKDHSTFLSGVGVAGRVFKSSLVGMENKTTHSTMETRIKQEEDTLFLVIHDEAHYEVTRDPEKNTAVNTFMNSEIVLKSKNVVTLLVSATPYNLVSKNSRIPEDNIIDWMTSDCEEDKDDYFGLARYAQNTLQTPLPNSGYIAADPDFEKRLAKTFKAVQGRSPIWRDSQRICLTATEKDILRCKGITNEYICAMKEQVDAGQTEGQSKSSAGASDAAKNTSLTSKIVKDLLNVKQGRGCMVLVRVTTVDLGKIMARQLRKGRNALGLAQTFAVVVDVEEKALGMSTLLKNDSSKTSGDVGWLERMRRMHGKDKILDLAASIQRTEQGIKQLKRELSSTEPEKGTNSKSKEEQIEGLKKKLAQLARDQRFPESYEDLKDLPVILILCQRGRIGDTFPNSLRYYDLRMKYSNSCDTRAPVEQDLGRAFRYGPETSDYPFPIVLVGAACKQQLVPRDKGLRSGVSQQLILLLPDGPTKMTYVGKKTLPNDERSALKTYRQHWKACEGHYDYNNSDKCNRRFLLVGRPQCGKTGAFLHLIALLWGKYGKEIQLPDPEEVEPPQMLMAEENERDEISKKEMEANMDLYPNFDFMVKEDFFNKPQPGKYGDPCDKDLIEWYLSCDLKGECSYESHKHFQKIVHQKASATSTAAALHQKSTHATSVLPSSEGLASTPSSTTSACVRDGEPSENPTNVPTSRYPHTRCTRRDQLSGKASKSYEIFLIPFAGEDDNAQGTLHVPGCLLEEGKWWKVNQNSHAITLKDRSSDEQCVAIPIFMPSRGRARCSNCAMRVKSQCNCGYLELQTSMITSGSVQGSGKAGIKCSYLQILVVIPEEVQAYKEFGPENAAIFELPAGAKDWGIGFSRYYTKKLAKLLCPKAFPFCLFMDDSVQYWRGITLPDDPLKPFGNDAGAKADCEDISLADVLLHFQKMPDLEKFGMLGFYRLNGWNQSNRAYKRSHVTSTVILNLEKLKNVEYLKKAFIWEDLQFNRDAENVASGRGEEAGGGRGEAAVICKCYRFAFSTPQLRGGGCHDMVANKAGVSVDAPAAEDTLDDVAHSEIAGMEEKKEELAAAPALAAAPLDIPAEHNASVDAMDAESATDRRDLSELTVEEVGRFVKTVLQHPHGKCPEIMAREYAESFQKRHVDGIELIQYTADDFEKPHFDLTGPRARHLFQMVEKAAANGLGSDLIPLPSTASL